MRTCVLHSIVLRRRKKNEKKNIHTRRPSQLYRSRVHCRLCTLNGFPSIWLRALCVLGYLLHSLLFAPLYPSSLSLNNGCSNPQSKAKEPEKLGTHKRWGFLDKRRISTRTILSQNFISLAMPRFRKKKFAMDFLHTFSTYCSKNRGSRLNFFVVVFVTFFFP